MKLKVMGLFLTGCLLMLSLTGAQYRTTGRAEISSVPFALDTVLAGVIDFHCHTAPDVIPRAINDLQLARLAKQAGMRGLVLKNHYMSTADRAQLVMEEVKGLEVFGGIVLNRAVGGINAEAVRRMAQVTGRRGKVVWLPTTDAENNFGNVKGPRDFVPVVKNGKLVPELKEVLDIIAQNDLVLETGHSSPKESILIIGAAQIAGVKNIVATHAVTLGADVEQLKLMAGMGAIIELCFQPAGLEKTSATIAKYAQLIKLIGAEHFLIDSDLGQQNNPLHPEGLISFVKLLKTNGISDSEIAVMACKNPAKLLGLTY